MKKRKSLKKIARITILKSMLAIAGCVVLVYPLMEKAKENSNYYQVTLNGQVIGGIAEGEIASRILKDVRLAITKEEGSLVYMEPELVVTKENRLFGTRMTEEELEAEIYAILKADDTLPKI